MSKIDRFANALLRWPILWGCLAALGFYALVHQSLLQKLLGEEFVYRYFSSHPVEHLSMTMFFVGMAALIIKAIDLAGQQLRLPQVTLGPAPAEGQAIEDVEPLLAQLGAPASAGGNYFVNRLRDALEYIRRKGSADALDEHLRFASDVDLGRMQASYGLVRIIIWAIPILGFLGTVIGITLAIAQLAPQELEKSLPEVILGLKIAFDTTALALGLSIILMFAQFIVDRCETRLLEAVDERTAAELVGRFQEYGAANDPQAASIRRMAEAVISSADHLVERQTELWNEAMDASQLKWHTASAAASKQLEQSLATAGQRIEESLGKTSQQLDNALSAALVNGIKQHATVLAEAERDAGAAGQARWHEALQTIAASTAALQAQQNELTRQGEILLKVVEATGEVRKLERTLNDNLRSLSGVHNFEETVMSLSAAIQLLTAHLHGTSPAPARVELHTKSSKPAKTKPSANNAA